MKTPVIHLCTDENHPDIFLCESDFKAAMNVLALCVSLFDNIELYAFVLMSNHIHLLLGGSKDSIDQFFNFFVKTLTRYLRAEDKTGYVSDLKANFHPVEDREHLLNVIVYIHRNPSVIDRNLSPYSYRWGSGRYYFNPEAVQRYMKCRKPVTQSQRQQYSHSRRFDDITSLFETDDYISPLSFCCISDGEEVFTSSSQYLFLLTRNVESSKSIAAEIGERISYNDYELFSVVRKLSAVEFGTDDPKTLTAGQKMILANKLHYDYNSGNKQISRLLKLDISITDSLFPQSSSSNLPHNRQY